MSWNKTAIITTCTVQQLKKNCRFVFTVAVAVVTAVVPL